MVDKKYAFLVENEIFNIFPVSGDNENETFLRWSNGFLNDPTVLDVSSIPGAAIGSIWDGNGFDNSSLPEESIVDEITPGQQKYAVINKENIVFMLLDLTNSSSLLKGAFEAAFSSGDVVGMDITNFSEDVAHWWTWDGETFSPPEES
jgi:hypothetical protein